MIEILPQTFVLPRRRQLYRVGNGLLGRQGLALPLEFHGRHLESCLGRPRPLVGVPVRASHANHQQRREPPNHLAKRGRTLLRGFFHEFPYKNCPSLPTKTPTRLFGTRRGNHLSRRLVGGGRRSRRFRSGLRLAAAGKLGDHEPWSLVAENDVISLLDLVLGFQGFAVDERTVPRMGVAQDHRPVRFEHNFGVDPGNRDVALLDRPEFAFASPPDSEPDTFRLDHGSRTVFAQEDSDFAFGMGRKGSRGTAGQGRQPLHSNRLVVGRNGGLSFHKRGRQLALSGHFNQKPRSRLPKADEVPDFNRHPLTRGEPALIEESAVGAAAVL